MTYLWLTKPNLTSTGFLIVAACIMIFESRDSAGKIAPVSANMHGPGTENSQGPIKVTSQTKIINHCSDKTKSQKVNSPDAILSKNISF